MKTEVESEMKRMVQEEKWEGKTPADVLVDVSRIDRDPFEIVVD